MSFCFNDIVVDDDDDDVPLGVDNVTGFRIGGANDDGVGRLLFVPISFFCPSLRMAGFTTLGVGVSLDEMTTLLAGVTSDAVIVVAAAAEVAAAATPGWFLLCAIVVVVVIGGVDVVVDVNDDGISVLDVYLWWGVTVCGGRGIALLLLFLVVSIRPVLTTEELSVR